MKFWIVLFACVMASLTYGEHLFGDPNIRPLAHYVADGLHISWLYTLTALAALFGMPRSRWRLMLVGAAGWGATEGAMTAVCGMASAPRVVPGQWQGLCGMELDMPLAAIGLSAFLVFVASIWGPNE